LINHVTSLQNNKYVARNSIMLEFGLRAILCQINRKELDL